VSQKIITERSDEKNCLHKFTSIWHMYVFKNNLKPINPSNYGYSTGMSLEAGNRRKSPVTLAVNAGYLFSLKKIMRENLSD
jgi:hypothetical protein